MFLLLAVPICAALVAAAPPTPRSPQGKKDPAILNFQALRDFDKPKGNTNQYYNWYDNIFEDHWGDRLDIGYTQFVEQTLRKGWEGGEVYVKGEYCKEEVTPVNPDPDFAKSPLDRIIATPIFCERGIMVLLQYDPTLATPAGAKKGRSVPCRPYAFRAYELAVAIDNKYKNSNGAFDPMFQGRKAIPSAPDSLVGKVYDEVVSFKWQTFDEVRIRIIGRTRWSQDQSEWIVLAILENTLDNCPFRVESFLASP
ncbi:uncharacterized protein DFL_003772 [Arthrobotrys flagrans]|uniref:Uncharacterized protein n=1 Tax=Arthrobotrys flagrans TaxID=97331 RepID=A0A437A2V8_ARTFL|nr:hypothetical protein DFL_003772 [Arthrobotrys flagrans]